MSRRRSVPARSRAVAAVCAALLALVAGRHATLTAQGTGAPEPVSREALVAGTPLAAPGQELQLVRYVIQPGTTLPQHTHPGMQIAWIESGILRYVVVEGGGIRVHRRATAGRSEAAEWIRPGQETDLHPGDTVVETEEVVHYGANRGNEVVVIWGATLLRAGEPPATAVDTPRP